MTALSHTISSLLHNSRKGVAVCVSLAFVLSAAAQERCVDFRENIPLDSIRLSDPFILPDSASHTYYMTGTGGLLWKSPDLKTWSGPWRVAYTDKESWMGDHPMIWAAELHKRNGRYYYFATFTNPDAAFTDADGRRLDRRACHVLVADRPEGPYREQTDSLFLPGNKLTLDATLWVEDGKPYMVYCHEWVQNNNGTVEYLPLKEDIGAGTVGGTPHIMFRAYDSPWSRENMPEGIKPNRVTDGPYLFRTGTGRLGCVWTSWIFHDYVQGVAYSDNGRLDGHWTQESDPITPHNYGHSMIFRTFDGRTLMCIHSHKDVNGEFVRVPHLFDVDLTGDKLKVGNLVK